MRSAAVAANGVEEFLHAEGWTAKTPGLQYVSVNASGVVAECAGGIANLARRSPVDRSTTMMAYSMSKTMTAVAVLQLVEAGKVGLEDPVARYVDALPYGPAVTVRHLLSHTSGIPNPIPLRWVHAASGHSAFDERAALMQVLRDHPRLSFRPGTRYRYSNIGYWLLGTIVERASGQTFASYVDSHIIHPLGLADAELGFAVVNADNHAAGYLERYSIMNLVKGFLIDRDLIGNASAAGSRSGRIM